MVITLTAGVEKSNQSTGPTSQDHTHTPSSRETGVWGWRYSLIVCKFFSVTLTILARLVDFSGKHDQSIPLLVERIVARKEASTKREQESKRAEAVAGKALTKESDIRE